MIEKYFCSCLNVIINTAAVGSRTINGKDLVIDHGDKCNSSDDDSKPEDRVDVDPFFARDLFEVTLAISGIETSQSSMIKKRSYGDWVVFNCLNCGLDTHSLHAVKGADRVLIPTNLDHGEAMMSKKKESANYSAVFKLKIVKPKGASTKNGITLNKKALLEATSKVNSFLKQAIKSEEISINEKIRIYEEKQKQKLAEFKLKAINDHDGLIKSLNFYESKSDSLLDSVNESHFGNPFSESRDLTTDLPKIKGRPMAIRISDITANSKIAHSLPSKMFSPGKTKFKGKLTNAENHSSFRKRTFSENDEILFDLDGFQDSKNCEPFYESDDESSGDATSLESSGGYSIPSSASNGLNPGDRVYATSVPVGIPLFENTRSSYDPDESDKEDDDLHHRSPSHIADSIKALARSMQDSTRVFGDLPRDHMY